MNYFKHDWSVEQTNKVYNTFKETLKDDKELLEKLEEEKKFMDDYEPIRFSENAKNKHKKIIKAEFIWQVKGIDALRSMLRIEKNKEHREVIKFHMIKLVEKL